MPPELADVAVGDSSWDVSGREWTVREVHTGGYALRTPTATEPHEFTWHAAMTLCLRREPAHRADSL